MAHRCGFTWSSLQQAIFDAGFMATIGGSSPQTFELRMVALKRNIPDPEKHALANQFLP
jgi:hypothetical protein